MWGDLTFHARCKDSVESVFSSWQGLFTLSQHTHVHHNLVPQELFHTCKQKLFPLQEPPGPKPFSDPLKAASVAHRSATLGSQMPNEAAALSSPRATRTMQIVAAALCHNTGTADGRGGLGEVPDGGLDAGRDNDPGDRCVLDTVQALCLVAWPRTAELPVHSDCVQKSPTAALLCVTLIRFLVCPRVLWACRLQVCVSVKEAACFSCKARKQQQEQPPGGRWVKECDDPGALCPGGRPGHCW